MCPTMVGTSKGRRNRRKGSETSKGDGAGAKQEKLQQSKLMVGVENGRRDQGSATKYCGGSVADAGSFNRGTLERSSARVRTS